jgi:hypothetical protein
VTPFRRLATTAAVLLVLGSTAPGAATADPTLHHAAVSARVPTGWHGRVVPGGGGGFLLLVSTTPIAAGDGDVLGATLRRLDRGGVLVALLGYGAVAPTDPLFQRLRAPLTTRGLPVHAMFEGMPRGDRVAREWFQAGGAAYDVQVYFGADRVTPELRARADAVLASLHFAAHP